MNEPPRGLPQYRFRCLNRDCEHYQREGIMAWHNLFTGKPVEPENFRCFTCHEVVEILGRYDQ